MKKFSYKIFRNEDVLLAIADKDIVGKTFKKKDFELDISKSFYHEDYCTEDEALELIKKSTIINAIGKNIIELMIKEDIVKKEAVLMPAGIPHAQIVTLL